MKRLTLTLTLTLSILALLWCGLLSYHEGDSLLSVERHQAAVVATATVPAIGNGDPYLDQPAVQLRLWGLTGVRYVVESAYAYESGLTGGVPPVADQDALLPYGAHERVKLPGGRQDHYVYYGAVYIAGSGTAMLFSTPSGGRFALVHIYADYLNSGVEAPAGYVYHGPVPAGVDDATGLAVQAFLATHVMASSGRIVDGGTVVGLSGWPSSYEYSNDSCGDYTSCMSDAHLCVVTDQVAQNWLFWLATGNDLPKPKPPKPHLTALQTRIWNQYRREHHKSVIPFAVKGNLTHAALLWRTHYPRKIGGIVRSEHWTPKGKGGRDGFEQDLFQGVTLTYWPRHPKWKPKWTRHSWKR